VSTSLHYQRILAHLNALDVFVDSLRSVLLNDNPDIIISTPTRLHTLLQSKAINLSHLSFLTIDEADLLLSYGHKDDLTRIMDPSSGWIPRLGVQGCLMSATLSEDVEGVKGLVLRNPVRPLPNDQTAKMHEVDMI